VAEGTVSHLSLFDSATVAACVVTATALMAIRKLRGVDHRARQWLDDALNVGTIIVLGQLVVSSFPWWPIDLSPNPLTDVALIYCAGLISMAMYRSILKTN
jgi:hypothetical protein